MKLKMIPLSLFVTISLLLSSVNANAQTVEKHKSANSNAKGTYIGSYKKKDGTTVRYYYKRGKRCRRR